MSVKPQKDLICCGVGPPRRDLLINAYLKLFTNALILAVFFYLAQAILSYAPNQPAFPLILILTISMLTTDSGFIIAIIFGIHLKKTSLLELYYKCVLIYMGIILFHGSIWLFYLMTRTSPGEMPAGVFAFTAMTTLFCLLFHAYFAVVLHIFIWEIIPGSQSDFRTTSPDLTDGKKNKIKEIQASSFNYV